MRVWDAQWAELPRLVAAHLELTLVSLAIALVISLPLGVLATRRPRLEAIALGVASVLQTIPGLALLALMVPLLGFLGAALEARGWPGLPSIGFLPAVLALSLYSLLPILRNTVTGVAGVDRAYLEAARGVGMSPREVLLRVELPLALPTLVAGIRTATVWAVGMATLATPVGGTSLGNLIFAGLQTRNLSAVLVGSLAAAALALCLDGLVRALEIGVTRRSRLRVGSALALLLALAGWAIWTPSAAGRDGEDSGSAGPVVIGSKAFTEQYILAEILAGVVERAPGVSVRRVPSLGSTVAFDALVSGELDVYVDYSGTVWATILERETVGARREEVLREVERALRADHDIALLARLGFENTYCLALRAEDANRRDLEKVSDLAPIAGELEILGDFEFFERPEWTAIETRYALDFGNERAMDSSLMYEALRSGQGDVISAYSTDGRIAAYSLRVLEDDRAVIPPYDAIILASGRFVAAHPELAARLRALEGKIDADGMRHLNALVDLQGEAPAAAAATWLEACLDRAGESGPCGAP